MFPKVIPEPPLSEFEGEEVCFELKMFLAIIFIHMRPLRDGNCGPTSAKGDSDEKRNRKNLIILFNSTLCTSNIVIIAN